MSAHPHVEQACPKPKSSRRWRNALWVCPTCQRAWVLRYTLEIAPRLHEITTSPAVTVYSEPLWQWWPWSDPTVSKEGSR